jgi:dipeptide/tripeptide permease
MIFVPMVDRCVLPWWRRLPWKPTAPRRMGVGMLLLSASFALSAVLEARIASAGEGKVNIVFQLPQHVVLTLGEILTSTTGAGMWRLACRYVCVCVCVCACVRVCVCARLDVLSFCFVRDCLQCVLL